MDDKTRLLSRVPLFAQLDGAGLEHVARLADEVDVEGGTVLMTEGRSGHEFFVIVDGAVRVERAGRTLAELGAGDFLGEVALVDGGPRTATATATEPSRLLVLGHREFSSLVEEHPDVRRCVLLALADRVRALDAEAT
jgi:CRP-like cAMP-binding protein